MKKLPTAVLTDLSTSLPTLLGRDLEKVEFAQDELVAVVRRESIARVLQTLRDDPRLQFKQLIDICGVDYPEDELRFEVVYPLL